jgi:hypothetical protein
MGTSARTENGSGGVKGALSSWRAGAATQAILEFVAAACGQDGSRAVPVEERVAGFDNDGTLWCEKPVPFQTDFVLRSFVEMAEADPACATASPGGRLRVGPRDERADGGCCSSPRTRGETPGRSCADHRRAPEHGRGASLSLSVIDETSTLGRVARRPPHYPNGRRAGAARERHPAFASA